MQNPGFLYLLINKIKEAVVLGACKDSNLTKGR